MEESRSQMQHTDGYQAKDDYSKAVEDYETLQALLCMPGEFEASDETAKLLQSGQSFSTADSVPFLSCFVNIPLEADPSRLVRLQVRLPMSAARAPIIFLEQPAWLTRKGYEEFFERAKSKLKSSFEENPDEGPAAVIGAVDYLRQISVPNQPSNNDNVDKHKNDSESSTFWSVTGLPTVPSANASYSRIWMHLPSLSTRSKRDDLVTYSSDYGITGIVCAGKPGLLILEAPSASHVEAYLSFIKSHSWADIPAGHKKISERLREEDLPPHERIFGDMREITQDINSAGMKGARGNRGDLGALRAWLESKGLGDRLAQVLGANFTIT